VNTIEPRKPNSSSGSTLPDDLYGMGRQALEDSRRWFPQTSESVALTVLALCGEAGEVANVIKKIERGSCDFKDPKVRYDLNMEVADVFTYLVLLAGQLGVDLIQLYKLKRIENQRRFGGDNGSSATLS
jgi:NTP pyrophosphatase (non-canonical NTP hydrolase)